MASLLLAAFASTNALSLVYLLLIALTMTLSPGRRVVLWSRVALPLLALLLVQQYASCVAASPAWAPGLGGRRARHRLEAWLGLRGVDAVTVGLLFAAYGLCGLLVRGVTMRVQHVCSSVCGHVLTNCVHCVCMPKPENALF